MAFNVSLNLNKSNQIAGLALANVEALAVGEGGTTVCKWKVIDCPGWGTGDYEACLENGDGNECTCGATTRECEK